MSKNDEGFQLRDSVSIGVEPQKALPMPKRNAVSKESKHRRPYQY